MAPLPLINVNLATVAVESVLYGVFILLSCASTYIHYARVNVQRGGTRGRFWRYMTPVFCGSILATVSVTGHWIMTIYRLFDAFVHFENGTAPAFYYADLSLTTEAIKTTFCISTLIICDILIIYRLWIVWGYNNYVIILPCCCVLGLCAAGPGVVYALTQVKTGNSVFVKSVGHWISADYSFTFGTNMYCSFGIAWRVWRARQKMALYGGGNLNDVLVTVIESAALYTTYVTFFFGCYQASSNVQYTAVDTVGTIAGISFMMINVRVGLGWAQKAPVTALPENSSRSTRATLGGSYSLRPVAIGISMSVETQEDTEDFSGNKRELRTV